MAKKLNLIEIIQKWMDTMAGQTFMNYAYSWGAAVVILGTLFKLTHLPGANLMLFIGMGTEVFVFIVAGFERVTERVPEATASTASEAVEGAGQTVIVGGSIPAGVGGTVVIGGGAVASAEAMPQEEAENVSEDSDENKESDKNAPAVQPVIAGGVGQPIILGGSPVAAPTVIGGGMAVSGTAIEQAQAQVEATDPSIVEEAVKNYAERLTELTDVLGRVKDQAERMSTDSEEMENLNRTLTGIATVYEVQLRNISKQVATIEQIDEQTRRMAQQIEELNNVYARMIKALTVNVVGPINPQTDEK